MKGLCPIKDIKIWLYRLKRVPFSCPFVRSWFSQQFAGETQTGFSKSENLLPECFHHSHTWIICVAEENVHPGALQRSSFWFDFIWLQTSSSLAWAIVVLLLCICLYCILCNLFFHLFSFNIFTLAWLHLWSWFFLIFLSTISIFSFLFFVFSFKISYCWILFLLYYILLSALQFLCIVCSSLSTKGAIN